MEDSQIVSLYWERKEEAIQETARKYGTYCYKIAYNILYNKEDAKESVNDTYMNAWNSMPPHKPKILSTFLGKITRYICLKKWRDSRAQKRGGGETALALDELLECIPDKKGIDETLEAKELARILDVFLQELPIMERRVFVCRYWYLDGISDIARQFNCSQSKIKSMLYRTRKKLLTRLRKEGVFCEI